MDKRFLFLYILFSSLITSCLAQSKTIIVDKPNLRLYVIAKTDTLLNAPVCVGLNYGDKIKTGDKRTPEGTFTVSQIQNSSKWKHDFGDGKGEVAGAYGPWFIRLKTPKWTSIGIHGTCFPLSIGTRASEGCIRLNNRDLVKLKTLISVGTKVIVVPDKNNNKSTN